MSLVGKSGILEIGKDAYGIVHEGGATNSGFIVGDEGVIVVEGLETKKLAHMVQAEVKKVTSKPIRSLICTHFHGDHALGNEYYLPVNVIGHALCRDEMIERWDYSVNRFATRYDENDPAQAAEHRNARPTPPDVVFHNENMTLYLGNKKVELYYFGKAHTSGDIVVYLPEDKAMYSGDVVTEGSGTPYSEDGFPASWVNVIENIDKLDIETIVPGHGTIGDKSMAQIELQFLTGLRDETRKRYDSKVEVNQAMSDISVPGFESWSDGDMFNIAVSRLYKEFSGEI